MVGDEVAALGSFVVALASIVQDLGNNYYTASAEWKKFPGQVELLRVKHADLEEQLKRYGQDTSALARPLKEAKKLLQKEVTTLERRRKNEDTTTGRRNLCCIVPRPTLGDILFPQKVGVAVRNASEAYDKIVEQLRKPEEIEDACRVRTSRSPISLPFRKDSSYVPLQLSESRIVSALKKVGDKSPNVILLYGGPGKGKSTVTRQISLSCQEDKSMFAHVVLLECGPKVDSQAKEGDLLQMLGWREFSEVAQLPLGNAKLTRQSRLETLLKGQKLLILLDDLCEPQFLQNLLIWSGPEVKFLVTSQRRDICEDLCGTSEAIQIQDLHEENMKEICRQMLAVHVGFPSKRIPDHLQGIADKILNQAEGIPLVIATMGEQIRKAGKDHPPVWEKVSKSFLRYLPAREPSKFIHGVPYRKSYWKALRQSIDGLDSEEKQLLLLIGMGQGPSIPEIVVFFLFSILCPEEKGDMEVLFVQTKRELQSRQLVSERSLEHLSVDSLTKAFIQEQMEATNAMAQKLGHSLNSMKTVTNPITRLSLDIRTRELRQSASKVFLDFGCNNSLDHDHFSQPLKCSTGVMPSLKFLQNICLLDKSFWEKNTIRGIFSMLQSIIGDNDHPKFQVQAELTLSGLSYTLFLDVVENFLIGRDGYIGGVRYPSYLSQFCGSIMDTNISGTTKSIIRTGGKSPFSTQRFPLKTTNYM